MIVERACKYVIYGTEAEIMAIRSLIGKTSPDSRCELGMKSDEALLLEDVYRTLNATEAEIMAIRSLIGKTSFDSRCKLGMGSAEALLLGGVYGTLDAALGKEDESCEHLS